MNHLSLKNDMSTNLVKHLEIGKQITFRELEKQESKVMKMSETFKAITTKTKNKSDFHF